MGQADHLPFVIFHIFHFSFVIGHGTQTPTVAIENGK
jgi:hypothetical protein